MKKHFFVLAFVTELALSLLLVGNVSAVTAVAVPVKVNNVEYTFTFELDGAWEIEHKTQITDYLQQWLPTTALPGYLSTLQRLSRKHKHMEVLLKKEKTISAADLEKMRGLLNSDGLELRERNAGTPLSDAEVIPALRTECEALSRKILVMRQSIHTTMPQQLRGAIQYLKQRELEDRKAAASSAQQGDDEDLQFYLEL